jgi:hypothetical protein
LRVSDLLQEIARNQHERHAREVHIRLAFPREVQVDGDAAGEANQLTLSIPAQLRAAGTQTLAGC